MRRTIKEIADVQIGYQPKGRIKNDPGSEFLIIQGKDVSEDGINWNDVARITPKRKRLDRYVLKDGEILFMSRGTRNIATTVRTPKPNSLVVGSFYVLKPRQGDFVSEYLTWYLNLPRTQEKIRGLASGSNIPLISRSAFDGLEIEIPPLDIQQKIAEVSALQQKEAQLTNELLELRQEYAEATCMQAIRRTR